MFYVLFTPDTNLYYVCSDYIDNSLLLGFTFLICCCCLNCIFKIIVSNMFKTGCERETVNWVNRRQKISIKKLDLAPTAI